MLKETHIISNQSALRAFKLLVLVVFTILIIPNLVSAMDFKDGLGGYDMEGNIVAGDAEKFRQFLQLKKNEWQRSGPPMIFLQSDGGNVWEALQMAKLLRAIHAVTWVGDGPSARCASACFYLYLAGIERLALRGSSLGIHRPFIDPSIYGKLSTEDASAVETELSRNIDAFLKDNQVPLYLVEKMNRTSSQEVIWLTDQEIDDIGKYPPWYEELLITKCGLNKGRERKYYATENPSSAEKKSFDEYASTLGTCKNRIFTNDLPKINGLLNEPIMLVQKSRETPRVR